MVLVDTSVWIDHFRAGEARLARLLEDAEVVMHPFVVGELACGNLRSRREILSLLSDLPRVAPVSDDEALFFIERHRLHGRGLGLVDVHLLASCAVEGSRLWSKDARLMKMAKGMELAALISA
jgi:predicted nucleic acid-binding protein